MMLSENIILDIPDTFGGELICRRNILDKWIHRRRCRKGAICEIELSHKFEDDKENNPLNSMETVSGKCINRTYTLTINPIYDSCFVRGTPSFSIMLAMTMVPEVYGVYG